MQYVIWQNKSSHFADKSHLLTGEIMLIHLMGTLDPKLSGHLSTSTVFSGLSGDIGTK